MAKKDNSLFRYSEIFSTRLPGTIILFFMLLLFSAVVGIASVTIIHYRVLPRGLLYLVADGSLAGIIAVLLPSVLTVIFIKMSRHRISVKHTLFIAIITTASYSFFILLGSILYIVFGITAATITILVGDASIFGWWFFINKVVLGFKKKAILFAFIQPTLNIMLYIPAGRFLFRIDTPFNLLILKLYTGILIFLLVSYVLLYVFDRPMKKSVGVGGIDIFSSMLQNWLFDINTSSPFSSKLGTKADVETNTIIFRALDGRIKGIFFIPGVHYGPAGTMGGSNIPYILERHVNSKYRATAFIMHTAVTAENNPISSRQVGRVMAALEEGMKGAPRVGNGMYFGKGSYRSCNVYKISFGSISLATFTRAPMVTDDIDVESAKLFRKSLQNRYGESILIDAHNSRYESAPKGELDGIRFGSRFMRDYINAIANIKNAHSSRKVRAGIASVEIYNRLNMPKDIGKGNLNAAVFSFGSFKYAMLQFNSNNILPYIRNEIISHVRRKYHISAEVYTTDTHSVNSIEYTVENVLGRYTKYKMIEKIVDEAMDKAINSVEEVNVYHKRVVMARFDIWGRELSRNLSSITGSVVSEARTLGTLIVISGFIIAAWIISLI